MTEGKISLGIETHLDFSGVERDLAQLNNKIQQNKGIGASPLSPKVDFAQLHKLNDLLDIKVEHLKAVQRFFDSNPLTVRTKIENESFLQDISRLTSGGTIKVKISSDGKTQSDKYLAQIAKNTKETFTKNLLRGGAESLGSQFAKSQVSRFVNNPNSAGSRFASRINNALDKAGDNIAAGLFGYVDKDNAFESLIDDVNDLLENELSPQQIGASITTFRRNFVQAFAESEDAISALSDVSKDAMLSFQTKFKQQINSLFFRLLQVTTLPLKLKSETEAIMQGKNIIQSIQSPKIQKRVFDRYGKEIEDKDIVTVTVGGFQKEKGGASTELSEMLRPFFGKNTGFVPIANTYTDRSWSDTSSEMYDFLRDLLGNDTIKMFGTEGLSMVKNIEKLFGTAIKGINPDSIRMAVSALAIKQKYPEKQVQLAGFSGGGYVVEQAIALLEMLSESNLGSIGLTPKDIEQIKGVGIGSPLLGLTNIASSKYRSVVGRTDQLAFPYAEAYTGKISDEDRQKAKEFGMSTEMIGMGFVFPPENVAFQKDWRGQHDVQSYLGNVSSFQAIAEFLEGMSDAIALAEITANDIASAGLDDLPDQTKKALMNLTSIPAQGLLAGQISNVGQIVRKTQVGSTFGDKTTAERVEGLINAPIEKTRLSSVLKTLPYLTENQGRLQAINRILDKKAIGVPDDPAFANLSKTQTKAVKALINQAFQKSNTGQSIEALVAAIDSQIERLSEKAFLLLGVSKADIESIPIDQRSATASYLAKRATDDPLVKRAIEYYRNPDREPSTPGGYEYYNPRDPAARVSSLGDYINKGLAPLAKPIKGDLKTHINEYLDLMKQFQSAMKLFVDQGVPVAEDLLRQVEQAHDAIGGEKIGLSNYEIDLKPAITQVETTITDAVTEAIEKLDLPDFTKELGEINLSGIAPDYQELLGSSKFSAEGLRKLARYLGITNAQMRPQGKYLPKSEMARGIAMDFTPEQINEALTKLGDEIKNKKFRGIELDVRPMLDDEQLIPFVELLQRQFRVLSETLDRDLGVEAIANIEDEIQKALQGIANLRKGFQLQGKGSSQLSGREQSLIQLQENAKQAREAWDKTAESIKRDINEIEDVADKQGYEIQKDIAEGSPGTTRRIREYWKKTVDAVTGYIKKITAVADDAGQDVQETFGEKLLREEREYQQKVAQYLREREQGTNPRENAVKSFFNDINTGKIDFFSVNIEAEIKKIRDLFDEFGQPIELTPKEIAINEIIERSFVTTIDPAQELKKLNAMFDQEGYSIEIDAEVNIEQDELGINEIIEQFELLKNAVPDALSGVKEQIIGAIVSDQILTELQRLAVKIIATFTSITRQIIEALPDIVGFIRRVFSRMVIAAQNLLDNISANIGNFTRSIFVVIATSYALSKLIRPLFAIGRAAFETAVEVERLTRSLNFSTAEGGEFILQRLKEQANDLNVSFIEAAQGYSQLSASTIGTPLEVQTPQLFEGLSKAISARGLSPENQQRAFLAFSQIASKGRVSLEEFTQQLSESLPGSLQVAARSLGLTSAEFIRLVESGSLASDEFLPKFAAQLALESNASVAAAAQTATAQLVKFENIITQIKAELGKNILQPLAAGLPFVNNLLETLYDNLAVVLTVVSALASALFLSLAKALLAIAAQTQITNLVLGTFGISIAPACTLATQQATIAVNGLNFSLKGLATGFLGVIKAAAPMIAIGAIFNGISETIKVQNEAVKNATLGFKALRKDGYIKGDEILSTEEILKDIEAIKLATANIETDTFGEYIKSLRFLKGEVRKSYEDDTFENVNRQLLQSIVLVEKFAAGITFGRFKRSDVSSQAEGFLETEKAIREAKKTTNTLLEGFELPSDELKADLLEIDQAVKRINLEIKIKQEKGEDIEDLKIQLDELQTRRKTIITAEFANYGAVVAEIELIKNLIAGTNELYSKDQISPQDYENKLRAYQAELADLQVVVDAYADTTQGLNENVREIVFGVALAASELEKAQTAAENFASKAQTGLIQLRLDDGISSTDFARRQGDITAEQLSKRSEAISEYKDTSLNQLQKLQSETLASLNRLFASQDFSGGLQQFLEEGTNQALERARLTVEEDADLTAALDVIEQIIAARDQSYSIEKEIAEFALDRREQEIDLLRQEIDRANEKAQALTEEANLTDQIAASTMQAARALTSFDQQMIEMGNNINVLARDAKNLEASSQAKQEASQTANLLEGDRVKLTSEARLEQLQAQQKRSEIELIKAQRIRTVELRKFDLMVKENTHSLDLRYQQQKNIVLAEQAQAKTVEDVAIAQLKAERQLLQLERQNTQERITLNQKQQQANANLYRQGMIDVDTYTDNYRQSQLEIAQLQEQAIQQTQQATQLELEGMQSLKDELGKLNELRTQIFEAQIRMAEQAATKTQIYTQALEQQSEAINTNAKLTNVRNQAVLQGLTQDLERIKRTQEVIQSLEEFGKDKDGLFNFDDGIFGVEYDEDKLRQELNTLIGFTNYDRLISDEMIDKLEGEDLTKLTELIRQAIALGFDANDLRFKGFAGVQAALEEQAQQKALEVANQKAAIMEQEQEIARKLLAIEIERNRIAAQTKIKEAEIVALRAQGALKTAQVEASRAQTPDELIKAQIAILSAKQEFDVALAQIDVAKESALLQQQIGIASTQTTLEQQGLDRKTEAFAFSQEYLGGSVVNPYADLSSIPTELILPTFDQATKSIADISNNLNVSAPNDKFAELLAQIDTAAKPLEAQIASNDRMASSTNRLANAVESLGTKIERLINVVGRPNINVSGGAELSDVLSLIG